MMCLTCGASMRMDQLLATNIVHAVYMNAQSIERPTGVIKINYFYHGRSPDRGADDEGAANPMARSTGWWFDRKWIWWCVTLVVHVFVTPNGKIEALNGVT